MSKITEYLPFGDRLVSLSLRSSYFTCDVARDIDFPVDYLVLVYYFLDGLKSSSICRHCPQLPSPYFLSDMLTLFENCCVHWY